MGLTVLINPVIKEVSGQQTGEEGCLSFPEITFDVTRSYSITVEALGIDPSRGVLRCSLVHYNTAAEVGRLTEALDALLER